MDFNYIWYLSIFRKYAKKIQVSFKPDKNNGYFTWRQMSSPILLKLRNVSDKNFRESQTHISCSTKLFRKSFRLWDNVKKNCSVGQATDGNVAHPQCMLDNQVYKHPLRMSSTYYCSAATVVTLKPLNITSYVYCTACRVVAKEKVCVSQNPNFIGRLI